MVLVVLVLGCAAGPPPTPPAPPQPESSGGNVLESPTVAPIVIRAGQAMESGDFDRAVEFYAAAYQRTPWNTRLRDALVAAYVARAAQTRTQTRFRDLERAERDLRAALELAQDNPELQRNLAVILIERSSVAFDPLEARALRAEAAALDPNAPAAVPERRADLERRLDMSHELIERGQLDAGIERLRSIVEDAPEFLPAGRLLGQALFRKGTRLYQAGRYAESGTAFGLASEAFARLGSCATGPCDDPALRREVRSAYQNGIVAWLDAGRPGRALEVLGAAQGAGLRFPDLERDLR